MTPLKKRRLARESVSQENPNLPVPSTLVANSSGLPTESLDASPAVSDSERGASDSEKSVAESDKSRSDLETNGRCKNGLIPGLSAIAGSDNLFEVKASAGKDVGSSACVTDQAEKYERTLFWF